MQPTRFDRFSKAFSTRLSRRTALRGGAGLVGATVSVAQLPATAQEASPVSGAEPASSFLYVQAFESGTLATDVEGWYLLTLAGAPAWTIAFADHPSRKTDALPTGSLPDQLAFDAANPPNAALVIHTESGDDVVLVLELLEPAFDGDARTLTYRVRETEDYHAFGAGLAAKVQPAGAEHARFGRGSLFIDSGGDGCLTLLQMCDSDADCCSGYKCVQANCADPNGVTFGHAMCYPSQD
jgi:hypothetical protein